MLRQIATRVFSTMGLLFLSLVSGVGDLLYFFPFEPPLGRLMDLRIIVQQILEDSAYNVIYLITYTQLKVSKFIAYLNETDVIKGVIKGLCKVPQSSGPRIELVKDGVVTKINNEWDFIKVSYKSSKGETNIKMVKTMKESDENLEVSNVRFMLIYVTIDGKEYQIDMMSSTYNYYVVNSILDKWSITYLMRNQYEYEMKSNENAVLDYTLNIIDSNAELLTIDSTKSVILLMDKYELL